MNKPIYENKDNFTSVSINAHTLASRRSAFSPYRQPSTVLTNLQRGNVQTQNSSELPLRNIHQLAALGELFLCNLDVSLINEVDERGFTPILWAAAYGQLTSINLLHDNGANIRFRGPTGENALIFAAANGHSHVVKVLLSFGVDVDEIDEDGNSALMYAAYGDYKLCVKELLDYGADMTLENSNLDSAYSISIKRRCKQVQFYFEKYLCQMLSKE